MCYNLSGGNMKGKGFVNFLAYCAIVLIALALVLEFVLGKFGVSSTVTGAMSLIAEVIAYALTAVFAFYFAKSRRNIGYIIAYIIAVILIIVFLFLG